MTAPEGVAAFLQMVVELAEDPIVRRAETLEQLPDALREQLKKACAAIAQAFYDPEQLRQATHVARQFRNDFTGGLRDARLAMIRCLIDNGGFNDEIRSSLGEPAPV